MKLPPNAQIAWRKITEYLLTFRAEDDKSLFLAQAGYIGSAAERLLRDLRQLSQQDASFIEATEYGDKYEIRGMLLGPNGRDLKVVTIWMIEHGGDSKFITLYPDKP